MGINVIDGFDVKSMLPPRSEDISIELHDLGITTQLKIRKWDKIRYWDVSKQEIGIVNNCCRWGIYGGWYWCQWLRGDRDGSIVDVLLKILSFHTGFVNVGVFVDCCLVDVIAFLVPHLHVAVKTNQGVVVPVSRHVAENI